MMRRFITLEGEIMAEENWRLRPTDCCFWCDAPLILVKGMECSHPFGDSHEFITLCNPGGRDG